MEWKHSPVPIISPLRPALGNFLSGMETTCRLRRALLAVDLGNFLSGMETT